MINLLRDFTDLGRETREQSELRRLRDNEKTMRFVIAGLSVSLLLACLALVYFIGH